MIRIFVVDCPKTPCCSHTCTPHWASELEEKRWHSRGVFLGLRWDYVQEAPVHKLSYSDRQDHWPPRSIALQGMNKLITTAQPHNL